MCAYTKCMEIRWCKAVSVYSFARSLALVLCARAHTQTTIKSYRNELLNKWQWIVKIANSSGNKGDENTFGKYFSTRDVEHDFERFDSRAKENWWWETEKENRRITWALAKRDQPVYLQWKRSLLKCNVVVLIGTNSMPNEREIVRVRWEIAILPRSERVNGVGFFLKFGCGFLGWSA